jgi:hypothetical protein
MRVGRPVPSLPHPCCDYCGAPATLARAGDENYPYREDHGPLWMCAPCQAWIGVFPRSKRNVPLGRLADARLRELKTLLYDALEPLAQAKVRRDGCNVFEARAKGIRWIAQEIGVESPEKQSIHTFDAEQCERAVEAIQRFTQKSERPPQDSALDDR